MRAEIESGITFTRDYGLGSAAGHAHVAEEQTPQEDEEDHGDDDQCPEGVLEVDLSGMSPEQSEPILLAARQAGLRVRQPFKRAPGGGGNRFQPRPKAKFPPRVPTPPRTGEREAKCGNCGGKHSTRDCPNPLLDEAKRKCFNYGEDGHQAKACPKPDRRKKQQGGKAMLVGSAPRKHLLGVVALDSSSPVPIPIADFPRDKRGAQARRKAAARLALAGGMACKCTDTACNNTPLHTPRT